MNIKKIRIRNFKSLRDVTIDVAPLTFLFGANSSGKSSIFKALLFLSKNLKSFHTDKTYFNISSEIDLLSFEQIVYNHDINNEIVFELFLEGEFNFLPEWLFNLEERIKGNKDKFWRDLYGDFSTYFELNGKSYKAKLQDLKNSFNTFINDIYNIDLLNDYYNFIYYYDDIYWSDPNNLKYELYRFFEEPFKYELKLVVKFIYNDLGKHNHSIEWYNLTEDYNLSIVNQESVLNTGGFKIKSESNTIYNFNNLLSKIGCYELICFFNDRFLNNLLNLNHEMLSFLSRNVYVDISYNRKGMKAYNTDALKQAKITDHNFSEWDNYSEDEKSIEYFKIIKLLYLVNIVFPKEFSKIFMPFHISPVRSLPKTKYLINDNVFNDEEYYGYLNYLFNVQEKHKEKHFEKLKEDNNEINTTLNSPEITPRKYLDFGVNNSLKDLGFKKFLYVYKDDNVGILYIIDDNNKLNYLANESSGLLQVLPILIELNKNKRFLLIEQPELHLHPKLQIKLLEQFTSDNFLSHKNLIIETHSEHMIKKIQVLICQKKITPDKVSVLFLNSNSNETNINKLKIDDNGFFVDSWPEDFFDDNYNLTEELLFGKRN